MRTIQTLISRAVAAQATMRLGRQMQWRMLVPPCSTSSARHIRSLMIHRRMFQTTTPAIPPLQTESAPSKADLGLQTSRESIQESSEEELAATKKQEARLKIVMTCTANDCGHRQSHEFTKHSYEKVGPPWIHSLSKIKLTQDAGDRDRTM